MAWELLTTLFSQLFSAMVVFNGIYSHLKNMTGYRRFLFDIICLKIRHNGVDFFLITIDEIEWTEDAVIGLQTLFSFWFSALGASDSGLMIQKSSRCFSSSLRVPLLTFDISIHCSIRVNFACFMKLWPRILKRLRTGIAFELLTSFLWLFNLKLKGVSDFATYLILHDMHSIK